MRRAAWMHGVMAAALLAAPARSAAQTATITGSVIRIDVVNATGHEAHGLEIEFEGLQPDDVVDAGWSPGYGAPEIQPSRLGTSVRWTSPRLPARGFLHGTLPDPVTSQAGPCAAGGRATGCEHFGVSLRSNPTKSSYHWLTDDPDAAGRLVKSGPPVVIPTSSYWAAPPAAAGDPAQVILEVEAPVPADTPYRYGDAQWMRIVTRDAPQEIGLDALMMARPSAGAENGALDESSWALVQTEPVTVGGDHLRSRAQYRRPLGPTLRAVVRRIELYRYTGAYDPVTHEARCADRSCTTPGSSEIGGLLSAQTTVANVRPDAVMVRTIGAGLVESIDRRIRCGTRCAAPYVSGTTVTLKARADNGSVFAGWTGACSGRGATCAIAALGPVDVTATFRPAPPRPR